MRIRRVSQCRAHGPSRLGQTEHLARQLRQTANRMEERNRIFAADFRLCRSLLRSPRRTDGPSTLTLNAKSSPTRTPHVGLANSITLHSQLWTKITTCRRDSPFPFQMFESEVLDAPRSPAPHLANTYSYPFSSSLAQGRSRQGAGDRACTSVSSTRKEGGPSPRLNVLICQRPEREGHRAASAPAPAICSTNPPPCSLLRSIF
jgi:hypothetical protein